MNSDAEVSPISIKEMQSSMKDDTTKSSKLSSHDEPPRPKEWRGIPHLPSDPSQQNPEERPVRIGKERSRYLLTVRERHSDVLLHNTTGRMIKH